MVSPFHAPRWFFLPLLFLGVSLSHAQTLTRFGQNFPLTSSRVGEQVFPAAACNERVGYVVYQDNAADGQGTGISLQRLDSTLSPAYGSLRVNKLIAGDQADPAVAVLKNDGAVVVWEGGASAYRHVYARFLLPDGTFASASELRVNVYTNGPQTEPDVAVVSSNAVVVVWSSANQDGHLKGIYGRLLGVDGSFAGPPFRINQFVPNNQRSPAVAALDGGRFVVVWVSENQDIFPTDLALGWTQVHVYARIYNVEGEPLTDEVRIDTSSYLCANPAVAATPGGGFTVVWSNKDIERFNSWDIQARWVNASGQSSQGDFLVNTFRFGDQFAPKIASVGANQLVAWTSLGQDGSGEGIFAQFLSGGAPVGEEFRVNDVVNSRQFHPVVAGDGASRFFVAWATYAGETGFDPAGQRFTTTQALPPMRAPWVTALSSSRLMATWPELVGFPLRHYTVFVDGATTPMLTTNAFLAVGGFTPYSSHSFRVGYVLLDGQQGPPSDSASARTWDEDLTGDGLPDDWQDLYWGPDKDLWGAAWVDSDGDGVNNLKEFMAGTNPIDPHSLLRLRIGTSRFGRLLSWSTEPGGLYQVQVAPDLRSWSHYGPPRLAAGSNDSLIVPHSQGAAYFRVMRMR